MHRGVLVLILMIVARSGKSIQFLEVPTIANISNHEYGDSDRISSIKCVAQTCTSNVCLLQAFILTLMKP